MKQSDRPKAVRVPVDKSAMGLLYVYEILAILAFISSLAISYAVILLKNAKRDFDHQIPIAKAFLYGLLWSPMLFFCALLIVHLIDG